MQTVRLSEALLECQFLPGLVVGQEATIGERSLLPTITNALNAATASGQAWEWREDRPWPWELDRLASVYPNLVENLEAKVAEDLWGINPRFTVEHLARGPWSAVVTLAFDGHFERQLGDRLDGVPTSKSVTVIDGPGQQIPRRSLPVIRLMGSVYPGGDGLRLGLRQSVFLTNQRSWPEMLKPLTDYVRDAPLFIIGIGPQVEALTGLLSALQSFGAPRPTKLLFQSEETALRDPTVQSLLEPFTCREVEGTAGEITDAFNEAGNWQGDLFAGSRPQTVATAIEGAVKELRDVICYVTETDSSATTGTDSTRVLLDALFSPGSYDWSPFRQGLDVRRNTTDDVLQRIRRRIGEAGRGGSDPLVVHGEAGVGKTTTLKRIAYELAKDGVFVLWARKAEVQNWAGRYRRLVEQLDRLWQNGNIEHAVIVIDDPWSLRVEPGVAVSILSQAKVPTTCVVGLRNTDYNTADGVGAGLAVGPDDEFEVPYTLTEEELEGLTELLTSTGSFRDRSTAEAAVREQSDHYSADILCGLWYLLPATREALAGSLQEEYRRLGEAGRPVEALAEELARSSQVAQKAYEFVTVTSNLRIGLPMEVLVNSLAINFDDWIAHLHQGRPLWGLVYGADNTTNETVDYYTRNHIVTRVLLNLVNRGVGRSGEHRVLTELIAGCDGGGPVYREFLVDLLVRQRSHLQEIFGYEQGIALYTQAQNVLPYEDRALAHQQGVWMKEFRDHSAAYQQLERALATPEYPGSAQREPDEHIHTSLAATTVQLVREGSLGQEEGLETIKAHLRKAETGRTLDTYTAHVGANQLFMFAEMTDGSESGEAAKVEAYSQALREIEFALQGISGRRRNTRQYREDVYFLTTLQAKILSRVPEEENLRRLGRDWLERSGSQLGYVVLARKWLGQAAETGRGRDFKSAFDVINGLVEEIRNTGRDPSAELISVRADLVIRWQVRRFVSEHRWEELKEDLKYVLGDPSYADNLLWRFYYAVCLFQLNEIALANGVFEEIRRMGTGVGDKRGIRAVYVGKEGWPKRLQCQIFERNGRKYARINDIGDTVPVAKPPGGDVDMSKGHVYLGFTLQGPLAVLRKPREEDIEMPRAVSVEDMDNDT